MKVGVIGAGHVGGALTRRLSRLGYDITVANSRGPDTLTELVAESGATAAHAAYVAEGADLVIVAVPERAVPHLPPGFVQRATPTAVVVDAGNYYPQRDGRIAEIEQGMPSSVWVAHHLGRSVVKAFNTVRADDLVHGGLPHGATGRLAMPVAGDDMSAKAVVSMIIDALGFDPIDAGTLADSWRQEPGSPCYGVECTADTLRRLLTEADEAAAAATHTRSPR